MSKKKVPAAQIELAMDAPPASPATAVEHEPPAPAEPAVLAQIRALLATVPEGDQARVPLYNALTRLARDFVGLSDPCLAPQLVRAEQVQANSYNPNVVASAEMDLLFKSIDADGFTQTIVGFAVPDHTEVTDGFHRHLVGSARSREGKPVAKWKKIRERLRGYLPIAFIVKPLSERMASTVRHNRARGRHAVALMSELVVKLVRLGRDDKAICKELGLTAEELIRLKQQTGIAALFANQPFSRSWIPASGLDALEAGGEVPEDRQATDEEDAP